MFANLESFSIFFFAAATLIILANLFEDKIVAYEEKRIARREAKRKHAKYNNTHKKGL